MPAIRRSKKTARAASVDLDESIVVPPTVFAAPGLKPDVCLDVFEEELHVHSIILRLYSNYFRTFLDSPDKEINHTAAFPYHYVTVVDDDGTWALESVDKAPRLTKRAKSLVKSIPVERESFKKLVGAMYNRPYTIKTHQELATMTTLADFYCALPILSTSMTAALLDSPMFKSQMGFERERFWNAAPDLLVVAKKLRNRVLFRECFIHAVGQFVLGEKGPLDEDPELFQLVQAQYVCLCQLLLTTHLDILLVLYDARQLLGYEDRHKISSGLAGLRNREFYKAVFSEIDENITQPVNGLLRAASDRLKDNLSKLLKNNLFLDQGNGLGVASFKDEEYLLCAKIEDDDMPWDLEEFDF